MCQGPGRPVWPKPAGREAERPAVASFLRGGEPGRSRGEWEAQIGVLRRADVGGKRVVAEWGVEEPAFQWARNGNRTRAGAGLWRMRTLPGGRWVPRAASWGSQCGPGWGERGDRPCAGGGEPGPRTVHGGPRARARSRWWRQGRRARSACQGPLRGQGHLRAGAGIRRVRVLWRGREAPGRRAGGQLEGLPPAPGRQSGRPGPQGPGRPRPGAGRSSQTRGCEGPRGVSELASRGAQTPPRCQPRLRGGGRPGPPSASHRRRRRLPGLPGLPGPRNAAAAAAGGAAWKGEGAIAAGLASALLPYWGPCRGPDGRQAALPARDLPIGRLFQ